MNDNILDIFTPDGRFSGEHNDCAVNALCNVTGASYKEAHALLAANGRKPRRGFKTIRFLGSYAAVLGHEFTRIAPRGSDGFYGPRVTVRRFAREHQQGKYLVCTARHALMVDQGVIVDSSRARPLGRIKAAWKVEKI